MRTLMFILLTAAMANAGRSSAWSAPFVLRERANATLQRTAPAATQGLLLTVTAQDRETITFTFTGISPDKPCALRIYGINGRLVADLSGAMVHRSPPVVWKKPALSRGLLFATLRSGNKLKTARIMLF